MYNYYIYKITDLKNGKIYIGSRKQSNKEKDITDWTYKGSSKILNGFKDKHGYHKGLYEIYGLQRFKKEILENNIISSDQASLKESFYIEKYDSFNQGYNLTSGPSSWRIKDELRGRPPKGFLPINALKIFCLETELVYDSANRAAKELNLPYRYIRKCYEECGKIKFRNRKHKHYKDLQNYKYHFCLYDSSKTKDELKQQILDYLHLNIVIQPHYGRRGIPAWNKKINN
jgi:hypothetical protein